MSEPRLRYGQLAHEGLAKMTALKHYRNAESGLYAVLRQLVRLRASLMNGCEYCIRLHAMELRKLGETSVSMEGLAGWRESIAYTDGERAALGWAEPLTNVQEGQASNEAYNAVRIQFRDVETVDLPLITNTINAWNRMVIELGSQSNLGAAA